MTFLEVLEQVRELLRSQGRISYRALKRQFELDDEYVADLKEELLFAHPQVTDEDGRGLVWAGVSPVSGSTFQVSGSAFQVRESPESEAEEYFWKAIEISHKQQAKSLELRATVSLARLWQQQGKKEEARQMLAEIYGWFTEGFDTTDLQDAKTFLAELSR